MYGLEKLHSALLQRPKGKPLLTVCALQARHCVKGNSMV